MGCHQGKAAAPASPAGRPLAPTPAPGPAPAAEQRPLLLGSEAPQRARQDSDLGKVLTWRHEAKDLADLEASQPLVTKPPTQAGVLSKPTLQEFKQGLAVMLNFPVGAVDQIKYVHPDSKSLVTEFWYDEEGNIIYDEPPPTRAMKYAKLFTKNSVYDDLGLILIGTSLAMSTVISQSTYCSQLFSDTHFLLSLRLKLAFVGTFALKCLVWVSLAFYQSRKKVHADRLVGDFVWEAGGASDTKVLFNTVLFHMFNVPATLSDASVLFHPRKPVQPYAAFKSENHRAWLVGWPTKEQHHVENNAGRFAQLPVSIMFDFPLVIFQVYFTYLEHNSGYSDILTLALSMSSLVKAFVQLHETVQNRRHFYEFLRSQTQGSLEGHDDQAIKQRVVQHKLLEQHFEEPIPEHVMDKAVALGFLKR